MQSVPSVGRCVANTLNIEEAHRIAEQYQAEGYETKIFEKKEAGLIMFEVWIFMKKEGLM